MEVFRAFKRVFSEGKPKNVDYYDRKVLKELFGLYVRSSLTPDEFLEFVPTLQIFMPLYMHEHFNDEAKKLRHRYPDPAYDRRVDLMAGLRVNLPTPPIREKLLEHYYYTEPDWSSAHIPPLPKGGLPQASTIWNFKDTPGGLAYTNWVKGSSLTKLPDNIRQKILEYLLPDEDRKISLSTRGATREVFPDGYFAKFSDVRKDCKGTMGTCKKLQKDLTILFWYKYKFHVTISNWVEPHSDPRSRTYLISYIKHVQHLTVELDFTRIAFSKLPNAYLLKADLVPFHKQMQALVNGLLARKEPLPFLHLMWRRYYGLREVEETDGKSIEYCGNDVLRCFDHIKNLTDEKVHKLRMSGFTNKYTHDVIKKIFGHELFDTITSASWPPVPVPDPPKQIPGQTQGQIRGQAQGEVRGEVQGEIQGEIQGHQIQTPEIRVMSISPISMIDDGSEQSEEQASLPPKKGKRFTSRIPTPQELSLGKKKGSFDFGTRLFKRSKQQASSNSLKQNTPHSSLQVPTKQKGNRPHLPRFKNPFVPMSNHQKHSISLPTVHKTAKNSTDVSTTDTSKRPEQEIVETPDTDSSPSMEDVDSSRLIRFKDVKPKQAAPANEDFESPRIIAAATPTSWRGHTYSRSVHSVSELASHLESESRKGLFRDSIHVPQYKGPDNNVYYGTIGSAEDVSLKLVRSRSDFTLKASDEPRESTDSLIGSIAIGRRHTGRISGNSPDFNVQKFDFPFLATTLYPFHGADSSFGFVPGEVVIITNYIKNADGWWAGSIGQRKGFLPKQFVRQERVAYYAIAIFDYAYPLRDDGGVNFKQGDRLAVMADGNKDFAYGLHLKTGRYGQFQRNYIVPGCDDINAIAKLDSILCRVIVKRGKGTKVFRAGDQIDVLMYINKGQKLWFGRNIRTKQYGKFVGFDSDVYKFPTELVELCRIAAPTDFQGDRFSDLSFARGDELIIIARIDSEYWYGKCARTGQCGFLLIACILPNSNPQENPGSLNTPSIVVTPAHVSEDSSDFISDPMIEGIDDLNADSEDSSDFILDPMIEGIDDLNAGTTEAQDSEEINTLNSAQDSSSFSSLDSGDENPVSHGRSRKTIKSRFERITRLLAQVPELQADPEFHQIVLSTTALQPGVWEFLLFRMEYKLNVFLFYRNMGQRINRFKEFIAENSRNTIENPSDTKDPPDTKDLLDTKDLSKTKDPSNIGELLADKSLSIKESDPINENFGDATSRCSQTKTSETQALPPKISRLPKFAPNGPNQDDKVSKSRASFSAVSKGRVISPTSNSVVKASVQPPVSKNPPRKTFGGLPGQRIASKGNTGLQSRDDASNTKRVFSNSRPLFGSSTSEPAASRSGTSQASENTKSSRSPQIQRLDSSRIAQYEVSKNDNDTLPTKKGVEYPSKNTRSSDGKCIGGHSHIAQPRVFSQSQPKDPSPKPSSSKLPMRNISPPVVKASRTGISFQKSPQSAVQKLATTRQLFTTVAVPQMNPQLQSTGASPEQSSSRIPVKTRAAMTEFSDVASEPPPVPKIPSLASKVFNVAKETYIHRRPRPSIPAQPQSKDLVSKDSSTTRSAPKAHQNPLSSLKKVEKSMIGNPIGLSKIPNYGQKCTIHNTPLPPNRSLSPKETTKPTIKPNEESSTSSKVSGTIVQPNGNVLKTEKSIKAEISSKTSDLQKQDIPLPKSSDLRQSEEYNRSGSPKPSNNKPPEPALETAQRKPSGLIPLRLPSLITDSDRRSSFHRDSPSLGRSRPQGISRDVVLSDLAALEREPPFQWNSPKFGVLSPRMPMEAPEMWGLSTDNQANRSSTQLENRNSRAQSVMALSMRSVSSGSTMLPHPNDNGRLIRLSTRRVSTPLGPSMLGQSMLGPSMLGPTSSPQLSQADKEAYRKEALARLEEESHERHMRTSSVDRPTTLQRANAIKKKYRETPSAVEGGSQTESSVNDSMPSYTRSMSDSPSEVPTTSQVTTPRQSISTSEGLMMFREVFGRGLDESEEMSGESSEDREMTELGVIEEEE